MASATPAFTNGRPSSAGGVSEAKRLRTLEEENTRLKRLLADAMLDIVPCDAALVGPCQDSVAGEFAAVVTDHHPGLAAFHHPPVQFTRHADAGERGVSHQRQALAGTIINDGQNAEAAAAGQLVRHKVERPALVRRHRNQHRRPGPDRSFAAAAAAYRQL